jgi:predicted dehydrogenase
MALDKNERRLQIGVLGCGPIAQAGHFEACTKASNADLYAICDVAGDLREHMASTHRPKKDFASYEAMLADPGVEAIIIATTDAFHVPAAEMALDAGKHVLCEKPVGISVEEVEDLKRVVEAAGLHLQVGHMKRFDIGLQAAKAFVAGEMGTMLALKAWYCDSTHRYAMTDAVQPLIVKSASSKKPAIDPKADLPRYLMLAHGCHLLDTARYFGGPIAELQARLNHRFGAFCWFVDIAFQSGAIGHLDLTIAVRMDWHEGFTIYGENGSVVGKTYNPWFYRSSDVEIFREKDATYERPLGADGHFYRRQLEGFADVVLNRKPMSGANIDDGLASVRAMAAIMESVRTGQAVRLSGVSGPV